MSNLSGPLYPGVYIETPRFESRNVNGVPVGIAGFIGIATRLDGEKGGAVPLGSYQELYDRFKVPKWGYLANAVRGFFENGGEQCFVACIEEEAPLEPSQVLGRNQPGQRSGLWALEEVEVVELLSAPDVVAAPPGVTVNGDRVAACQQTMVSFATGAGADSASVSQGGYFCVLDTPPGLNAEEAIEHKIKVGPKGSEEASWGAMFYPWLVVEDDKGSRTVPPSGHIAGGFARTSHPGPAYPPGEVAINAGPHHSPANTPLGGVISTANPLGRLGAGRLIHQGLNCLIPWPARGTVVWGARTMSVEKPNDQISVRRVLSYIERSVKRGTQWALFEPNDDKLWKLLQSNVKNFLDGLYKRGLLVGNSPEEAYICRCDASTNTADDRSEGRLIVDVWVRPVRPIEMIVLRIVHSVADER